MEIDSSQLTSLITGTLNEIIGNLFSSISNNIYSIMDDITFISEQILSDPNFQKILGSSSSDGILLIANSLLLGFIIYYAIRLFFSYYHQSQIQRPYQFLVRIFLIGIFMNSSYFICEKIIALNHILSSSIRNLGEILFQKNICFSSLISELNAIINIQSQNFDLFSFDGILKCLCYFGLVNLLFSYSLRYIMVQVFVLICPFSILSLSISSTTWFFKAWYKTFFSLLILQSFIAIILLIIFSFNFNENLISKFLYIGGLYSLIKANLYIKELIGGISTEFTVNLTNIKNLLKS